MCVHRSPDCTVFTNYEVVKFQPRSGIATVLDSVASITTYSSPAHPTYLSRFLDSFIYLLPSTSPLSVSFFVVLPLSHCNTCSPTPILTRYVFHLDFFHPYHPPASAACLCALRRVPASDSFQPKASTFFTRVLI